MGRVPISQWRSWQSSSHEAQLLHHRAMGPAANSDSPRDRGLRVTTQR